MPQIARRQDQYRLWFTPSNSDDDGSLRQPFRKDASTPKPLEELPHSIELWDEARESVEQVLAITATKAMAYAAYYAATKEHPERYITLRLDGRVAAHWNRRAEP